MNAAKLVLIVVGVATALSTGALDPLEPAEGHHVQEMVKSPGEWQSHDSYHELLRIYHHMNVLQTELASTKATLTATKAELASTKATVATKADLASMKAKTKTNVIDVCKKVCTNNKLDSSSEANYRSCARKCDLLVF